MSNNEIYNNEKKTIIDIIKVKMKYYIFIEIKKYIYMLQNNNGKHEKHILYTFKLHF